MEEGLETTPARRRGRPRKSERIQGLKDEDPDTPTGPTVGKRKMVEAVLESDSMKHPCHGRTGMQNSPSNFRCPFCQSYKKSTLCILPLQVLRST